MAKYAIQEGIFELPEDFTDRTVNTFIQGNIHKSQFNFTISRDISPVEETLEAYVKRQISIIQKSIKGYKLLKQQPCELGRSLEGIFISGFWKDSAKNFYQRQAAFFLSEQDVLILSASSANEFNQHTDSLWYEWLDSFQIAVR